MDGEFLNEETDGRSEEIDERKAWLRATEQALMRIWDNPGDEVYEELLRDSKGKE
jgi:hypothetical protein